MSDLYDDDILLWSKRQADALRRRATNEIDWNNVAEEIESVGNEQRFAVGSLLINIMQHLITAWPEASAASHWQHEIDGWRVQIERRLRRAPALRPVIEAELAELYRDAVRSMYRQVDGMPRPPVPDTCPFTLDQLLAEEPDDGQPEG
jgi:hypothetical protein